MGGVLGLLLGLFHNSVLVLTVLPLLCPLQLCTSHLLFCYSSSLLLFHSLRLSGIKQKQPFILLMNAQFVQSSVRSGQLCSMQHQLGSTGVENLMAGWRSPAVDRLMLPPTHFHVGLSMGPLRLLHGMVVRLLVFWGCYGKIPQTGWLQQRKFIFSQFWSLEV